MFNFKKKKKSQTTNEYDKSAIDASELIDDKTPSEDKAVYPSLSLHPDWKLAEEDKYVYNFLNNDLPPLKSNQISLHGTDLEKDKERIIVKAFVRSSLSKSIKLKDTPILLLDKQGTKVARKEFNLDKVGSIPPLSSRPWVFIFEKEDMLGSNEAIPANDWKLAFELKKTQKKHALDLAESWEKSLASKDLYKLEEYVENINPPKPGEVNFLGLKAQQVENGNLHVTLLIRNGSDKNVTLENLPLRVEDATEQVVAQGSFKLDNFQIKSNTSKPWSFIFPESMINSNEIDLSTWKAYPIQK
ncbi:accessory Sec system S-layer assembly protein [Halobacillus seohaensis]|uniref:Accessory Sec system S-layer assembly protein n=1 Tax=Halobacillus seohaensis TaxID=447421 RepID=A0ABW2ELW2_9BACI